MMTKPARLLLSLLFCGSLWLLPAARAAQHRPPPRALQQALQKFLQQHPGRLLKLEYEETQKMPYYRVEYLDGQGVIQHLRIWSQGQENLNQPVKGQLLPPERLLTLPQLLKKAFGSQSVRLLEASLKPYQAGFQYKLEWLDSQGNVWEGRFDARTGRQITRKRD